MELRRRRDFFFLLPVSPLPFVYKLPPLASNDLFDGAYVGRVVGVSTSFRKNHTSAIRIN